jgi:hypothetical protein
MESVLHFVFAGTAVLLRHCLDATLDPHPTSSAGQQLG